MTRDKVKMLLGLVIIVTGTAVVHMLQPYMSSVGLLTGMYAIVILVTTIWQTKFNLYF